LPRKILWVEDDIELLRSMEVPLLERGYELHEAKNYLEAISSIANFKYDLIILDMIIPSGLPHQISRIKISDYKLNGLEFLEYIRDNGIQTQVIVFSVVEDPMLLKRLKSLGVNICLKKGLIFQEDLDRAVEESLRSGFP